MNDSNLFLHIDRVGPGAPGSGFGSESVEVAEADQFDNELDFDPKDYTIEMLPPEVDLGDKELSRLTNYLDQEIARADSDRWPFLLDFARYRTKYKAKFPEWPKDWPIANSSQLTIPLIKITCDTLTSRIYQTAMAADPMISVRTKNQNYRDFADGYERFLGMYNRTKIDIEDRLDTIITEMIKLGTAVAETTTLHTKRALVSYDPLGRTYSKKIADVFNGPAVHHVPIDDFWIPLAYQDVDKAPWCGKVVTKSWSEIKDLALSGYFNPDKINEIWRLPENPGNLPEGEQVQQKLENRQPTDWDKYRIFELFVRWDADGDGIDEDLIVYFHWETRTILRIKYNTFKDAKRPFTVFRFKRIEHRFYGEGMAETMEQMQEELSTIHNQRIDNATMANLQVILVTKYIKGLSPGDRLWTGKIVKVTDTKDVGTLRLGETYPSTMQAEEMTKQYANELSGVGEVASGQAQPVTRTTAAAQLSLLEELNRRFDKVTKGVRKSIKDIGSKVTDLFAEYGTNGLASEWLGDSDGQLVEQMLADPTTFSAGNAYIDILATSSSVNREVEFQSAIAVMNLIVQMGQQFMALAQQFQPQAAAEVANALVQALRGPWKKVMQYSDSGNVEEATAVLSVLERILPAPENLGGMGPGGNPTAGPPVVPGASGGLPGPGQSGDGAATSGSNGAASLQAALAAASASNGRSVQLAR